jgi:hypothetical protein
MAASKATKPRLTPAVRKAARLSERFHGKPPRHLKDVALEWPRALVRLGRCARIDYVSDKFDGKTRRYFHDFRHTAQLFTSEKPLSGGRSMLLIIGKFSIKPEGITG